MEIQNPFVHLQVDKGLGFREHALSGCPVAGPLFADLFTFLPVL
jgi:hypothetical protein